MAQIYKSTSRLVKYILSSFQPLEDQRDSFTTNLSVRQVDSFHTLLIPLPFALSLAKLSSEACGQSIEHFDLAGYVIAIMLAKACLKLI